MTGPACGNNPHHQLTDGDRRVVEDFKACLTARAALLSAADWYTQQGKTVLAAAQVAVDLRRRANVEMRRMADDVPPADQTGPSQRAGLHDEIVKALGQIATVPPVAHRLEQADHVLAVLYREWPWLRAEAEDAVPSVDQAALRDRIAAALYAHDHPSHAVPLNETGMEAAYRETAAAVLAVLPATPSRSEYDALVAEADRLRRDGAALYARAEGIDKQLTALQKQVAAPVDRAAVLREAADVADGGNNDACGCGGCADCTAHRIGRKLRRMADETAATETAHQPRRGDQFEAWLKAQRDDWASDRADVSATYDALDDLLDLYRLHADTGTPLGEHVCEGQAVGDCECLEQPAAGAGQDGAQR